MKNDMLLLGLVGITYLVSAKNNITSSTANPSDIIAAEKCAVEAVRVGFTRADNLEHYKRHKIELNAALDNIRDWRITNLSPSERMLEELGRRWQSYRAFGNQEGMMATTSAINAITAAREPLLAQYTQMKTALEPLKDEIASIRRLL